MMRFLFVCFLSLTAIAQTNRVAVELYGLNTNGVATNFPATWMRLTGAQQPPVGWQVMTLGEARALKAATQWTMDLYQSNLAWQAQQPILNAAQAFRLAQDRLVEWEKFLGTPQMPGSNFVNIAQASQWAREVDWLMKRVLLVVKPLYKPEEDQ